MVSLGALLVCERFACHSSTAARSSSPASISSLEKEAMRSIKLSVRHSHCQSHYSPDLSEPIGGLDT